MMEMLERIARALAVYQFGSSASWEDQAPMARAAIEAMREPNKAGTQLAEIYRLRAILKRCMGGAVPIDIGGGQHIFLYQEDIAD